MLTPIEEEIVVAICRNNLSIKAAAEDTHYNRNTLYYHIDKIKERTGLDAKTFYGAFSLLCIIGGGVMDCESLKKSIT